MKLYHVTSAAAAKRIMRGGFKDGRLSGLSTFDDKLRKAVSLLDLPADENEGAASSEACIEVDVPDDVAAEHEMLEELLPDDPEVEGQPEGSTHWVSEWAIPARVLNLYPRRLLSDEDRELLPSSSLVNKFRRIE